MFDVFQPADESILFFIQEHIHTPLLDKLMVGITTLGNHGFIWIAITFTLLLFKKTRTCGILLTCALTFEFLLGDGILKPLIGRERPFIRFPEVPLLTHKPGSFSFPSGHTMSSFTAATVIFYSNKYAGLPAFILAGLIGFSRIYLFFHYPTDVLCGMILGVFTSVVIIKLAHNIRLNPVFGITN